MSNSNTPGGSVGARPKLVAVWLGLLVALSALTSAKSIAVAETPAGYLQKQPKPVFQQGHGLARLSRFGWTLPLDARVELARHWGYALELGGYTTEKTIERLADPESIEAQVVAMARKEPEVFPLQVILSRKLPTGDVPAVAEPPSLAATDPDHEEPGRGASNADAQRDDHFDRHGVNPPGDPWTRNAKGELIDGKRLWSPEAPEDIVQAAADYRAGPLGEIARRAPVAIVLNGGEYAMTVLGFAKKYWQQDPRIEAARGDVPWFDYISQRKAHMEFVIAEAVRRAAPQRQQYIFYTAGGGTHRNRWGGWKAWAYGFRWMQHVSDLPTDEFYYCHFNSGWTGDIDMLTQALNVKGHELEYDKPLNYNWLCAGWPRGKEGEPPEKGLGDLERYMGFLKCLYTAGMVGANGGYYAYPKGGFAAEFPDDEPPHWLRQMIVLARAHALFSHLEEYLRQGDLLPGPKMHVWSKAQPAYELPTGDEHVRALARKHRQRREWLVCVWAAAGDDRRVSIEIPDSGKFEFTARPAGSVYLIDGSGEAPKALLVDADPILPSRSNALPSRGKP